MQLTFMSDKINELEELHFVLKNYRAEWASPPLNLSIFLPPGPMIRGIYVGDSNC
jgi:hypothetical protein